MTSHQSRDGESDPAEGPARQGEDLSALLTRLLGETGGGKQQVQLAEEAGINPKTLSAWILRTRGTSRIEPDTLRSLAAVFQGWGVRVTVREFFEAVDRHVPGATDEERERRLLGLFRQLPVESQRTLILVAEAMRKGPRVV